MAKMSFFPDKARVVTATLKAAGIPFTAVDDTKYCIVESQEISAREFKELCEYAALEQNAPFPRLPLSLALDRPLRERLFGYSAVLMNENAANALTV